MLSGSTLKGEALKSGTSILQVFLIGRLYFSFQMPDSGKRFEIGHRGVRCVSGDLRPRDVAGLGTAKGTAVTKLLTLWRQHVTISHSGRC